MLRLLDARSLCRTGPVPSKHPLETYLAEPASNCDGGRAARKLNKINVFAKQQT